MCERTSNGWLIWTQTQRFVHDEFQRSNWSISKGSCWLRSFAAWLLMAWGFAFCLRARSFATISKRRERLPRKASFPERKVLKLLHSVSSSVGGNFDGAMTSIKIEIVSDSTARLDPLGDACLWHTLPMIWGWDDDSSLVLPLQLQWLFASSYSNRLALPLILERGTHSGWMHTCITKWKQVNWRTILLSLFLFLGRRSAAFALSLKRNKSTCIWNMQNKGNEWCYGDWTISSEILFVILLLSSTYWVSKYRGLWFHSMC